MLSDNHLVVADEGNLIKLLDTPISIKTTPKTALIKIKDPREYYQKLIIHNNLKSYRDYLV